MPRPKVSEEARKRIAKACLHCQSSKLKCDGKRPCSSCIRRQRSAHCAYSDHVRSYGHRRRRRAQKNVAIAEPKGAEKSSSDGLIEIAVPKLPQSLYDTRGKVVYLGDCAALSFLQNLQELIEREAQSFSSVPRFREFEELPPDPDESSLPYPGNIKDLERLIQLFFAATSGVLDIIEPADAEDLLARWIHGSLNNERGGEALLYLILAYAAQAQASSPLEYRRAHSFYHHGRRIALLHLTDDPSLESVQAFLLISLYMLGCSRRNGAFLNLGVAISAAKALGLHRRETNLSFPDREARLRARIWASLRYHDLFFCAMMGRTSSTITTDCTVASTSLDARSEQEAALQLAAHAFSFMERTVNEIYTKRNVSMGSLKDIARELQEAIHHIPSDFTVSSNALSRNVLLRNSNVLCSYNFSMMLLTRPFLVAKLRASSSSSSSSLDPAPFENDMIYNEITTNSLSCIDAAIETVRILHRLLTENVLLSNMPLTVAWTFVSALTICSAYFGQLGTTESNEEAIVQAGHILDHFAVSSPQARRYSRILQKLSDAASAHKRVDRDSLVPDAPLLLPNVQVSSKRITLPELQTTGTADGIMNLEAPVHAETAVHNDPWDISNLDMNLFPLDLGNADSIWDLNWVGSLM